LVGLLTAPLSLAREPLRLTLLAWEFGLSTAAEAVRIGRELLEPDRDESPADLGEPAPAAQPEYGNGRPPDVVETEAVDVSETEAVDVAEAEAVDVAEAAPADVAEADAPPPVPGEFVPDHVDEEPVLVAEAAEEGAEEGAGAELHVDPPWDGYDQMTAADIRDRLAAASATEAAAVELYETSGKRRRSVLDAAERTLRR
jgi:hypothetical protein